MKKTIYYLIGLLAIFLGLASIYNASISIPNETYSSYFKLIIKFIWAGIGIYGGLQLFRLREIGRKLLLLWSIYYFSMFVFVISLVIIDIIFDSTFINFHSYQQNLLPILWLIALCLWFLFSIILLHRNRNGDTLLPTSRFHFRLIGKFLTILVPGIGRAFISNTWIGLGLFYVYYFLMLGSFVSGETGNVVLGSDLIFKLIIWSIFSKIDDLAVEKYFPEELPSEELDTTNIPSPVERS